MNKFSAAQLAELRKKYSGISGVDPSGPSYKKLASLLDSLPQEQLKQLSGAGIPFVSKLALNRVKKNPAKKKSSMPAKRNEFAYRHYLIRKSPVRDDEFYISRDGFHIGTAKSEADAKKAVDDILGPLKNNPRERIVEVKRAAELYEKFTGHGGETIARVRAPKIPKAVAVIGECDGILYSTVRDGVLEKYIHKFKKSARPLFCVSPDGKQIFLIGGEFRFTERGIVDKT